MEERQFTLTTNILSKWFTEYNKRYFNNQLPRWNFKIKNNVKSYFGLCRYRQKEIIISTYRDRTEFWFKNTFIHELIHEYQYINNLPLGHGESFKKKAAEINALDGWQITRCSKDNSKPVNGLIYAPRKKPESVIFIIWNDKLHGKVFSKVAKSNARFLYDWAKNHYDPNAQIVCVKNNSNLGRFIRSSRLAFYSYLKYGDILEQAMEHKLSIAV